jgi:hypothetical protein
MGLIIFISVCFVLTQILIGIQSWLIHKHLEEIKKELCETKGSGNE